MDQLETKEKEMKYVEKCPHCGGTIIEKEVKEVLSGGTNTAFLTVKAGVCLHCGERLYTPETIRRFEYIVTQLEHEKTDEFQIVGKSFQVVS